MPITRGACRAEQKANPVGHGEESNDQSDAVRRFSCVLIGPSRPVARRLMASGSRVRGQRTGGRQPDRAAAETNLPRSAHLSVNRVSAAVLTGTRDPICRAFTDLCVAPSSARRAGADGRSAMNFIRGASDEQSGTNDSRSKVRACGRGGSSCNGACRTS
jgi:hypothetical protein